MSTYVVYKIISIYCSSRFMVKCWALKLTFLGKYNIENTSREILYKIAAPINNIVKYKHEISTLISRCFLWNFMKVQCEPQKFTCTYQLARFHPSVLTSENIDLRVDTRSNYAYNIMVNFVRVKLKYWCFHCH